VPLPVSVRLSVTSKWQGWLGWNESYLEKVEFGYYVAKEAKFI